MNQICGRGEVSPDRARVFHGAARGDEPRYGINKEVGAFEIAVGKPPVVKDGEESCGLVDQAVESGSALYGGEGDQVRRRNQGSSTAQAPFR